MAALSDWARTLLQQRRYATLATQDDDGSLHLTPVWVRFFKTSSCSWGSSSSSRRFETLSHDRPHHCSSRFVSRALSGGSRRRTGDDSPWAMMQRGSVRPF